MKNPTKVAGNFGTLLSAQVVSTSSQPPQPLNSDFNKRMSCRAELRPFEEARNRALRGRKPRFCPISRGGHDSMGPRIGGLDVTSLITRGVSSDTYGSASTGTSDITTRFSRREATA